MGYFSSICCVVGAFLSVFVCKICRMLSAILLRMINVDLLCMNPNLGINQKLLTLLIYCIYLRAKEIIFYYSFGFFVLIDL